MTGQVDDETFIRLMAQYMGRRSVKKIQREVETPPPEKRIRLEDEYARRRRERAKFQKSAEWRALAALVKREQPYCAKCGATDNLQADHIKPKAFYPELRLVRENIRTLCRTCNFLKGVKEED